MKGVTFQTAVTCLVQNMAQAGILVWVTEAAKPVLILAQMCGTLRVLGGLIGHVKKPSYLNLTNIIASTFSALFELCGV